MNKTIFSIAALYFLATVGTGLFAIYVLNLIDRTPFEISDLGQVLIMAIAFPLGSILGLKSRVKGSLKFLHSDTLKLSHFKALDDKVDIQKFNLEQYNESLILSGLISTFADYSEGIVKVRQQNTTFNLGCGAMISLSDDQVNIKSFPVGINSKKGRQQFQDDLLALAKVLANTRTTL